MSKIIGRFEPMTEGFRSFDVVSMSASSFMNDPGYEGEKPDGSRFHVFTKHWKWIPAWTGSGLPPVGTVCEYLEDGNGDWKKVRIVAIDHQLGHAFAVYSGDKGYSGDRRAELFRPIRTPEQIAAEVRLSAIAAMMTNVVHATPEDMARLYDAGYRKFEITDE